MWHLVDGCNFFNAVHSFSSIIQSPIIPTWIMYPIDGSPLDHQNPLIPCWRHFFPWTNWEPKAGFFADFNSESSGGSNKDSLDWRPERGPRGVSMADPMTEDSVDGDDGKMDEVAWALLPAAFHREKLGIRYENRSQYCCIACRNFVRGTWRGTMGKFRQDSTKRQAGEPGVGSATILSNSSPSRQRANSCDNRLPVELRPSVLSMRISRRMRDSCGFMDWIGFGLDPTRWI
jgi:hypothetical protein